MSNVSPTKAKLGLSPPKSSAGSPTKSTDPLQKQYQELAAKLASVTQNYSHLEEELSRKSLLVNELSLRVSGSEKVIRSLEDERHRNQDLHEKELHFYKESVEELQRRNQRISNKLELGQAQSQAVSIEIEERLAKLTKSYKVLQSNLELEQNSKALLIDQIEYLTKERDFLLENADASGLTGSNHDSYIRHELQHHNSESESDGSVHGTRLLDLLTDDIEAHQLETSSPMKDSFSDNSLDMSMNFQFPPPSIPPIESQETPLADPTLKAYKRQSLPANLRPLATPLEDDAFVLSPLKLANQSNSYFEQDTSLPTPNSTNTKKRYSSSKPHHSRYNSHDIVPIKVEFEQPNHQLRSASSPDKEYLRSLRTVDEDSGFVNERDEAFRKLNGETDHYSKRDSVLFSKRDSAIYSKRDSLASSSKRSSLITDFSVLGNDVTKQEIMKLKFELQSLKLHNEKLLSYIGFELQKQKKNIKKLSSKQNLRGNMEYSDAKLIENLRKMLIQKKRVLRSVSINPILSSKYEVNRKSSVIQPGVELGFRAVDQDEDDDFVFESHFINSIDDCDDYGFLNHESKYNLRVLSRKNQAYLNEEDRKLHKKFRSQTFRQPMSIDEVSFIDDDYEDILHEDVENEEQSSGSESEIVYSDLNTFNQIRYLIFGKGNLRNKKKSESLVDENLKYKFLTLAIGIVIVGIKFTSQPQQHLTHN